MRHEKIRLVLLFVVLSGTMGCVNSHSFVLEGQVEGKNNNIFNGGKTYIKLEEFKSTKGAPETFLDHPQYVRKDILTDVLSSISFKKKGIRGWNKEQYVFHESELLKLTSHITEAFTRASPSQYILVNSNYTKGKRLLKAEVYTMFGLFISSNTLNIVFSRIQYEGIIAKGREKTFLNSGDTTFVDPFRITKNPFWKITIRSGQRLKNGHDNWLIIDLEKDFFTQKKDHEKNVAPRDIQEEESKPTVTGKNISDNPSKNVLPRTSIKDQILDLKELETAGLITKKEYETRKGVILGSSKRKKGIKDRFNELRKLKENGFINDRDYEQKKRNLLEGDDDGERGGNIKEVLAEYLELRNEGFITNEDYEYKKKKLLKDF